MYLDTRIAFLRGTSVHEEITLIPIPRADAGGLRIHKGLFTNSLLSL